jgi:hypothetical protein
LTSKYGRTLASTKGSSATTDLALFEQPPYTDWWRYVLESEIVELTTFSVNLNQIECFETALFRVFAGSNEESFVEPRDFSIEMISDGSYLSLESNETMFASITGIDEGVAVIAVTYKVSGLVKTFEVNVIPHRLRIGISTDNYFLASTPGNAPFYCPLGDRGSSLCSDAFWNVLSSLPERMDSPGFRLGLTFCHNNGMIFGSASKQDMLSLSEKADFMLFVGHGLAADAQTHYGTRERGNSLHYAFDPSGNMHYGVPFPDVASCFHEGFNFYTSEARFGSSENSNLKWVLLYSCNFLHTSEYVSEDGLKGMLQGARIVMGYSTRCCLYSGVTESIASQMAAETPIIDAFFVAGRQVERSMNDGEPTEQVASYISGARNDTIFNVFESTTPTNSTVLKVVNGF